jgi:hypothetical protein
MVYGWRSALWSHIVEMERRAARENKDYKARAIPRYGVPLHYCLPFHINSTPFGQIENIDFFVLLYTTCYVQDLQQKKCSHPSGQIKFCLHIINSFFRIVERRRDECTCSCPYNLFFCFLMFCITFDICHFCLNPPPQINARGAHLLAPTFELSGVCTFSRPFSRFPLFSMKKAGVHLLEPPFQWLGVRHLFGHCAPKGPRAFIWGGRFREINNFLFSFNLKRTSEISSTV